MVRIFKYIFVLLLILGIKIFAQGGNKIIAKVGNQNITEREFKLRYELVPHYTRDQFNKDSSKIDLLNSLIAEKLLAQEANMRGFDTTDYYRYSVRQIEDLYARDALYKKVIDTKVKITPDDIQKALERRSKFLYIRIISSYDSASIFSYYSLLLNGAPFDSIGRISDPVEYDSNKPPLKITYGQMQDDHVEDILYGLRKDEYSKPIKSGAVWFIFKLVGVSTEVPPNANDPDYNRTITNVIRMRKSRVIGMKYLEKFYKDKSATIDSTLFLKLAQKISSILSAKKLKHDFGRDNKLFLNEGDIMSILRDFGNKVDNENIVNIKNSPVNLKEYLYSLIIYPLLISDPSFKSVAYNLMGSLNKYIQYKFLSDEGFKEGLQHYPDVREKINIWKDNFLAKMLKNTFRDSVKVTEEDVRNYYKEKKGIEKLDLLQILNGNLEVIETVFKGLKEGRDFGDLAGEYSRSEWTRARSGELGYLPVSKLGEIGKIAAKMKLNQVYGPIRTDSGYAVIKLIGKKIDSTKSESEFKADEDLFKDELQSKEFNEKFFRYIAGLSEKYKYSVNLKNLKEVKVLDVPMFTYKYIGFGGRIAAMPFLDAWYGWTKYLKPEQKLIP